MRHELETTGPVTVAAKMRSSALVVSVSQEEASQVVVDVHPQRGGEDIAAQTRVELVGDRLEIVVPKSSASIFRPSGSVLVTATVPLGSSLEVDTGSGALRTHGPLARAEVKSGSGDVAIDQAEEVRVSAGSGDVVVEHGATVRAGSGSGDVRVGRATVSAEVRTGSGDISLGQAADLSAVTGSGDVVVDDVDGQVTITTGSGDVLLRRVAQGEVQAKAASGDVVVGVAAGTAALLDCSSVSGRVTTDLASGDAPTEDEKHVVLRLRSVAGDVRVQRG